MTDKDKIEIEEFDPDRDYESELHESLMNDLLTVKKATSIDDLKPVIMGILLREMVST